MDRLREKTIATLLIAMFLMAPMVVYAESTQSVGLTVNVAQVMYTLTINIVGSGSVYTTYGMPPATPTTPGPTYVGESTSTVTYGAGTVVSLVAGWTDPDWKFGSWTGDVEPHYFYTTDWSKQVTLDADKTVTVTFLPKLVSINVDPMTVDFGTVIAGTPSAVKTVTVTNDGDYDVDVDISVDGLFYEYFLRISDVQGPWNIGLTIDEVSSLNLQLQNIPKTFVPSGSPYTGTLLFTAVESP